MATAPARSPNNLPVQLSSFIGRARDIDEIALRVSDPTCRLLTLTGAGGCGKTRLSIAIAQSLSNTSTFEHGVWFIELAGLDNPILVAQALIFTLGVSEARGLPLVDTLKNYLQAKKLLIVLDNCEHLLQACAELAQALLESCPDLCLLATSREPLNLINETVWLVPSLTLPEPQHSASIDQLAECEAIQLFVERAHAALPDFALNEHNAFTIEQICRRLDGIPLAIELAAARVKLLDVVQIAARLDVSLQLLTRGSQAAALRHRTMRATVDWSYQLLAPHEQPLFRRLAVFADGFTLEALEAICAEDLHAFNALDVLSDLIDKSLVLIAEREPGEAVRYRLLEPTRQYAFEKLREADEEVNARDKHLDYFVEYAEQAEPLLKSEAQLRWLKRLDKDHDNMRAALAWSMRDARHAVAALRLGNALYLYWQRRGYWTEGRGWLEQTIAFYDAHPQPGKTHEYLGRALVAYEWLAVNRGDYNTAHENLERSLVLAQASHDPRTMSYAYGLLSSVSIVGDASDAYERFTASVKCAQQSGDRWTLALAAHVQGRALYRMGEVARSRAAFTESERLFRETGDKWSIAAILSAQAGITDQLDVARALYEEVFAIFQEFEHKEQSMVSLSNLASIALLQGDMTRAQNLYEQTLAQARELQNKATIAFCLRGLGRLCITRGDFDAAENHLHAALAIDKETGHQIWVALSLAGLGRIAAARDQTLQAARALGAINAFINDNAINLDNDDQLELGQHDTAIRASMTPQVFDAGFVAGHELTLEQALEEISRAAQEDKTEAQLSETEIDALRLYALGSTNVFLGEQALSNWSYARVKELLFYLVSHPARTRAQIGLALWPDASPSQLRNSFSTALYHLRRALGDPEWIIFEEEQYRFNRVLNYRFDVEAFELNLMQAAQAQTPQQAIALLEAAIDLYKGDFVEDYLEGEWFLLRREDLRRKYLDALIDLGRLHFEQNDFVRAAETYRRAIEKDEMLEEAHRELMRCYARLGERGQALRHYQTLEQIMRDELGSPPAPESVSLYERLKRGEEV